MYGSIFDTYANTYIQEFCYVYNDTYYDLKKAIEGVLAFDKFLNSWVRVEIDKKPYDPKSHFVALCVEIRENETANL